ADAQIATLPRRRDLPQAEFLQADELARAAQQLRKVAGVVDLGEAVAIEQAGVVRHCFLGHDVARAHFGRLEAQLRRQPVDDAFHGEYRLGSAGAAIGGSEGGMREHALHQDRCIGHVVGAEKVRERVVWHHHAEKVVRAAIHHPSSRSATRRPSRVAASAMRWIWSRACGAALRFSLRLSTQRTGRASSRAAKATSMSSADCTPFCPKRSEEHTSELQSLTNLVCRLLLEKKKKTQEKQNQYL